MGRSVLVPVLPVSSSLRILPCRQCSHSLAAAEKAGEEPLWSAATGLLFGELVVSLAFRGLPCGSEAGHVDQHPLLGAGVNLEVPLEFPLRLFVQRIHLHAQSFVLL